MKKSSKRALSRALATIMLMTSMFSNVVGVNATEVDELSVDSSIMAMADENTSGSAVEVKTPEVGVDYSFNLADGSIIPNDGTLDGSQDFQAEYFKILVGAQNAYKWNDAQHGMSFKTGNAIELPVAGAVTVKFGACQYTNDGATITATSADGSYTLEQNANGLACTDTIDFVYNGDATTLTFAFDNQVYVPSIEVVAAKDGTAVTEAEKNIMYSFDFTKDTLTAEGTYGIMTTAANGVAPAFNGAQHGVEFKPGNTFTFKVAGNSYIKIGGCQYSGSGNFVATSATGEFENSSIPTKTAGCYDQTGDTVDFLYVGGAGEVTITNDTAKAYVPYIEIVPVPHDVDLVPWVQRNMSLSVNGTTVDVTGAVDSASNSAVTLSAGTVLSATTDAASIMIDLGGATLSADMVTGTIADATYEVVEGTIVITFTDNNKPYTYTITVGDSSNVAEPEYSRTYNYDFTQAYYETANYAGGTVYSEDMLVEMNATTYNGTSHGIDFGVGKTISVKVAGDAELTFGGCQYSRGLATVTNGEGTQLATGVVTQTNQCYHNSAKAQEGETWLWTYSYEGPKTTLTFTFDGSVYIPNLTVVNADAPEIIDLADSVTVDVWDFDGEVLADEGVVKYNNNVSQDNLIAFTGGQQGFSTAKGTVTDFGGGLSFTGDIRFYNTTSGSYQLVEDAKKSDVEGQENPVTHIASDGTVFEGFVYANGATNTNKGNQRYFTLNNVKKGDRIGYYFAPANATVEGAVNFLYTGEYGTQSESIDVVTEFGSVWAGNAYYAEFIADCDGSYDIWTSNIKCEYMRVVRTPKTFFKVSGNITVPNTIPAGYRLTFTNNTSGEVRYGTVNGNTFEAALPYGYEYTIGIEGANGFIVDAPNPSVVTVDGNKSVDVNVVQIPLVTVSGYITGLDNDALANMVLTFTPDTERVYVPEQTISGSSISVVVEPDVNYTITAEGINDYEIVAGGTINTSADVADYTLAFQAKTVFNVRPVITGLTDEQKAKLVITFTNLNEEGYTYSFSPATEAIALRNGTYSISYSGIDEYPVKMKLTPNLTIANVAEEMSLEFKAVDNWKFMSDFTADHAVMGYFQGLVLTSVQKDGNKYLTGTTGTITVPVKPGQGIIVDYTYQADFYFDDPANTVHTESKSTNIIESAGYAYTGTTDGTITITMTAKTYLRNIRVVNASEYKADLYVGADKEYKTINEAMDAVYTMNRPNNERVTINIDPGNYEEMVNVNAKNVTFKNSAANPSIALTNKGVDIDANAVRITSYYGTGYNYYSMADNYKWDEETLAVNKENNSWSTKNAGGTSTTLWNATVCVFGEGFEADGIIFENSFNQYISEKEAADTVVLTSEGKGERNHYEAGSTAVQDKSHVERAAALAVMADKVVFNNCRFVGRQDTLYGQYEMRAYFKDCAVMGATDYIFGGMIATFDNCDLVMNTSDDKNDYCYITAAQQKAGRGFLFWNCTITSTTPGVDTASEFRSKQGFFGRPWQKDTSEAVFYNTTIETTNRKVTGHGTSNTTIETVDTPVSLIYPDGWLKTLGGESVGMYEYNTTELSGEDNSVSRVSWCTMLTEPTLLDGTTISREIYTNGTDGWNPIIEDKPEPVGMWGDVDSDGVLTGNDAALILNYSNNNYFTGYDKFNFAVGDVDGTAGITANDAAMVYQKVLNLSYVLPVEKGEGTTTEPSTETTTSDPVTETTTAEPAGDAVEVFVVGDSTGCDYAANADTSYYYKRVGFGTALSDYFTSNVTVKNLALSGRSSKSFLTESNYQTLLNELGEGDYLLIAFGHNDEKADDASRYTNPTGGLDDTGSFKYSLYENYIKVAEAKGATPILVTPVVRRTTSDTWSNSSLHIANGGDYAQCIRDLGADKSVAVIDNTTLTKDLYTTLTPTESIYLHAWLSSKDSSVDNTHLNNYGAHYVAYMMAQAIKDMNNGLSVSVADVAAPVKGEKLIVNPSYVEPDDTDPTGEALISKYWTTTSPWYGTVFGDIGGQSKLNNEDGSIFVNESIGKPNFAVTENADGTVNIRMGEPTANSALGKISGATDAFSLYYQPVDAGSNFELNGTIKVNSVINNNNQVSFGAIMLDTIKVDNNNKDPYTYVSAGVVKMTETKDAVTSDVTGTTAWNTFSRIDGTLATNADVVTNLPKAGDEINVKIVKVGDKFTATYGDTTAEYTVPMTGTMYVGFYATRAADITVSNISYNNEVTE